MVARGRKQKVSLLKLNLGDAGDTFCSHNH
jgi:hypothetical protein